MIFEEYKNGTQRLDGFMYKLYKILEGVSGVTEVILQFFYRTAYHVSDLGWVDFDFDAPFILSSWSSNSDYLSSVQAESGR